VSWLGKDPPPTIDEALRAAEIRRTRRPHRQGTLDADTRPTVVFSDRARAPAVRGRGPWVWLCGIAAPDPVARQATLQGAYAVIALREPNAAEELVARLDELLVPDPPVKLPPDLIMGSPTSRRALARAARVAATAMPVLLIGETGTGKEVLARLIHSWSTRAKQPWVAINCSAIPNDLMEAELFGYARGAFSGAVQRYDGQLMAAAGGTVFLDEIDDTPLEMQVKLLRVLENRVVSRLGENIWHEVDFRLIAATNRDLRALIDAGAFGADLYERLAIVTIHLPPLRDRVEDIPQLVQHFLGRFAREEGRQAVHGITGAALRALEAYHWPGNVRELRNVLYETLVFKRAGDEVLLSDLPRRILKGGASTAEGVVERAAIARRIDRGAMNLKAEVTALQRLAIDEALARAGGNAAEAARLLGEVGRGVARDPGGTLRAMIRRLERRGSAAGLRR
jgi:transcriptional regulator with PAS, ATPase and Fis domain